MSDIKQTLTTRSGTAVMLNIVLGAGLLSLPGLLADRVGHAALLVWIACALASLPLLIVFGLVGKRHPDIGGIANFAGLAYGKYLKAMTTCLFLGAVLFGLPSIALIGGHYLSEIISGPAHIYAIGLLILAVSMNLVSITWTSRINTFIAGLVLVCMVAISGIGLAIVLPDHPVPTVSWAPDLTFSEFGFAFMMVFFAFTGWEVAANLSADFKNSQRDFPRAMIFSFIIAVLLYLSLALIAGSFELGERAETPFSYFFELHFGASGRLVIAFVAILLIVANLSAAVWAVSRMVCSAARDNLLPQPLGVLRNDIPLRAVLFTSFALISIICLAAFDVLNLGLMLAIAGQNFLLIYGIAAVALLALAHTPWEKVLALFCIGEVSLLVFMRGVDGAFYPILLCALAALSIAFQTGNLTSPKNEDIVHE